MRRAFERIVERSHRVDNQEFYQLLDQGGITDDIHLFNKKLRQWEDYYSTAVRTVDSMDKHPTNGY